MIKLLFIDRDALYIRQLLAEWNDYDFEIRTAISINMAIETLLSFNPDIIISEYSLPNSSLPDTIKRIRSLTDTPIIVLTTRTDELAALNSLQYGADDFIKKTDCSSREIFFRLLKALKNVRKQQNLAELASFMNDYIEIGDITINKKICEVKKASRLILLSTTEYRLLLLLAANRNRVIPLKKIRDDLFSDKDSDNIKGLLYTYFSNIRKKLSINKSSPMQIRCISKEGYCLVYKE